MDVISVSNGGFVSALYWENKTTHALLAALGDFYVGVSHSSQSDVAKDAMRLRHEVFCKECGFEPLRPDDVEHDAYDADATHLVIYTKEGGEPVGCARLLDVHPLPASKFLQEDSPWWPARFAPETATEISRLVVKKSERGGGVLVLLVFAMTFVAQRQRYLVGYASMESRLTKFISMMHGLTVTRISNDFEFRGKRHVSLLEFSSFYDNALQAIIATRQTDVLTDFLQGEAAASHFSKEA